MSKREYWYALNLSTNTFSLGDLPVLPSFAPNSYYDLLEFYDKDTILQSTTLVSAARNNWIQITKVQDGVSTVVDPSNLAVVLSTSLLGAKPCAISQWYKITLSYFDFLDTAMSASKTIFELPPGSVVDCLKIKHATAFSGPLISSLTISVGISGDDARYTPAFDVMTAPSSTNFQLSNDFIFTLGEDHDSTTWATATAVSEGASLDSLTGGSCNIWIRASVAH